MDKKKSFVLYHDYYDHISSLKDEEKGKLLSAIFEYEIKGVSPQGLSDKADMAFSFIRATLDRDREKYINRCQKNSANGKKGGRGNKSEKSERFSKKRTQAKKADNDNESDNDNDNDSDNESESDKENALALDNEQESKKVYGEFSNVLLTEVEYSDLCNRFGNKTAEMIDFFSAKLKAKGYYFENHYATIILWAKQDGRDKGESMKSYDIDDFFDAACKRAYEELENVKKEI